MSENPNNELCATAGYQRIVFLQQSMSRSAGGLFFSVRNLALALKAEKAIDPIVLSVQDEHSEADRAAWGDIPIVLRPGIRWLRGFSPTLIWEAMRVIRKEDVVYQNGIWSPVSIISRIALRRGARVVVAPRGMLDPYILRRNSFLKKLFFLFLERRVLERAHAVHALTAKEAQQVKAAAPRANVFVCPNGVEFRQLERPANESDEIRFVYIGRLDPKKQLIELVQAFGSLGAETQRKWRLHIHGWGSDNYVQRLSDEIAASRVRDRIDLLGAVYGEEKTAALAACHFFVLPSASEGLPMAVLEAIASGRAVIVTDECNLDRILVTEPGCFLLPQDRYDWKIVLGKAALTCPEQAGHLGRELGRIAESLYGLSSTIEKTGIMLGGAK